MMKFEAEIDLKKVLIETSLNRYDRGYITILDEVSLGYGIADIVVSNFVKPVRKKTIRKIPLDYIDINVYNLVKSKCEISVDDIIQITRCKRRVIKSSLKKLIFNKYVKNYKDLIKIHQSYELPFESNFAIEAKLRNWKHALKQAYRYKWFAEYSYVVLDAHYSKAALKNIDEFVKYNVGLATITREGNLERHFKPQREKPFDSKMQILLSEKMKFSYEFAK